MASLPIIKNILIKQSGKNKRITMKPQKTIAGKILISLLLLIVISIPVFIYITYIQYLGFPDGHLTELNQAEKIVFNCFAVVSILFALFLLYSWFVKLKIRPKKSLLLFFSLYLFVLTIFFGVVLYLQTILENGAGG